MENNTQTSVMRAARRKVKVDKEVAAKFKAERKAEIREVDIDARREAFAVAVRRLGIKTIDAPAMFGVDRRTFNRWTAGTSRIPVGVFLALVQMDNEAYLRRERATIEKYLAKIEG